VSVSGRSVEAYILTDGKYELDNVYAILPDYVLERLTEEERADSLVATVLSPSMFPDMAVSLAEVFEDLL